MHNQPNWDEAPSGATLFCTNLFTVSPWFKTEDGKLYNFYDREKQWFDLGKAEDHLSTYKFSERPTVNQQVIYPTYTHEFTPERAVSSEMEPATWNGNGVPPDGAVCEIYLGNYHSDRRESGEVVKILATAKNSNDKTMVLVEICEKDGECDVLNVQCLRPFRNERDRWVEAAQTYFNKERGEVCPSELALVGIYDALKSGALKAPEVK